MLAIVDRQLTQGATNVPMIHDKPLASRRWQQFATDALPLVGLWLALRVLYSLWAALVSARLPRLPVEQVLPIWPPSLPLGAWLERALLIPWLRRDAYYYVQIAGQGYRADDGTAQFHPLFPWLGGLVARLLGAPPLLGLLVVTSAAALVALLACQQLARLDLEPAAARRASLYFALYPVAFILFAPYSEALFVACALVSLLCARRGHWLLAGLCGGLAALTRQQGIVLLLPLAWEAWHQWQATQAQPTSWRAAPQILGAFVRERWGALLGLALVPCGFLLFKLYRMLALGDVALDASSVNALIYSLLISPSSSQVVPVQGFRPPWEVLAAAFGALDQPGGYTTAIDLLFSLPFVALLVWGWRALRPSYRIYSAAILLLSFSYYTGPFYPTMGLPRHCLLAVPLFFPLARYGGWVERVLVVAGVLGGLFLALHYTIEGWVP
jgi:hypothetical protein